MGDYLQEQGDPNLKSLILFEGVKGWANAGPEYTALMDEYEESVWM
jgi:arsenical-resistance protein 2